MIGNNISNKSAPYIMFNIDSILFLEDEKKDIFAKVKDMFKTTEQKKVEREFNPVFLRQLDRIWARHNVCIGLVTFDIRREEAELMDRLVEHNVPYTRLFTFDDWEELRNFQSIYTVSKNEDLLSFLSQNHAIHYNELGEVLK